MSLTLNDIVKKTNTVSVLKHCSSYGPSLMQRGFTLIRGWPLIRSRLSDMRREVGTFGEKTFGYNLLYVPRDEKLPTWTPYYRRTTTRGVNII